MYIVIQSCIGYEKALNNLLPQLKDIPNEDIIIILNKSNKNTFYKKPKEIYKFIGHLLKQDKNYKPKKILDIGCANGAFLNFLTEIYPQSEIEGWDISGKLLAIAKKKIPAATFKKINIEKPIPANKKFDLVVCIGVTGCLNSIESFFKKVKTLLEPNGTAVIAGNFNDYPIDVRISYQDITKHKKNHWETGWNIFSKEKSIKIARKLKFSKILFLSPKMPFSLKKRKDDFARNWTIKINRKNELTNGLCVVWPHKVLKLKN